MARAIIAQMDAPPTVDSTTTTTFVIGGGNYTAAAETPLQSAPSTAGKRLLPLLITTIKRPPFCHPPLSLCVFSRIAGKKQLSDYELCSAGGGEDDYIALLAQA